jgi:hypothetical protein
VSLPRAEYEAQVERNARTERDARRALRWSLLRTCLELVLSIAFGFSFIAWSAHTHDPELGLQLFHIGQLAWIAGVMITLLVAYRRGERRGDW